MSTSYLVERGDAQQTVTIASDDGATATISIGGATLQVTLHTLPDGTFSVQSGGSRRRMRTFSEGGDRWLCEGPRQGRFSVRDERTSWLDADGAGAGAGGGRVAASMPGRVVKLAVAIGDVVAAGDILLVLEAMKMENDIKAKAAGVVVQIAVKMGDAVENGQLLLQLEPPA